MGWEEITKEIRKNFEMNENKNKYQNLWEIAKAVLEGNL